MFIVFTLTVKCCVYYVYIESKMLCSLSLHQERHAVFIMFTLTENAVFIVFTSRMTCCVHCIHIKSEMLCSQGKAFVSTTLAVKCSQSASVKTLCSFRAPTVTSATDGIPPQCAKYRQVSKRPCKILPGKSKRPCKIPPGKSKRPCKMLPGKQAAL